MNRKRVQTTVHGRTLRRLIGEPSLSDFDAGDAGILPVRTPAILAGRRRAALLSGKMPEVRAGGTPASL